MSAVEDIRIKLEHRLILVEQEIESLRSALAALDSEQAAAVRAAATAGEGDGTAANAPDERAVPSRARRAAGTRTRGGRARPAQSGDSAPAPSSPSSAELERLLAETGGMTAVELARQTGTDYGEVLARIRQLEQAGESRR